MAGVADRPVPLPSRTFPSAEAAGGGGVVEHGAVVEKLFPTAWHSACQYENNHVECDHHRVKATLRPMRVGLRRFHGERGDPWAARPKAAVAEMTPSG